MRNFLIITFLFFSFKTFSQDSISVLFIGNSYLYTNDLPNVFKNITISKGDIATVDSKTNGGFTFQSHVNDPITFQKINSKPWDYVVLQGQSQEPSFPYGQVNTSTLPYAVQLADSVYSNAPCSQAMYFMTWGRQVGDPQWDSINTFDKMNLRLRNAYLRIADSANASVSPSGPAWKYVIDNHPTINLFSPDGSHPSYAGTYLSACVFYGSIFHKSPMGATFLGSLDQATADILQYAASITVLDSMSTWKLKHHDSLAHVEFVYSTNQGNSIQFNSTVDHVDNITWYFGDDMFSNEQDPLHTYSVDGTYLVELVGTGACGNDTASQLITISTAMIETLTNDKIQIDLVDNSHILMTSSVQFSKKDISLFDATGKAIQFNVLDDSTHSKLIEFKSSSVLFIHIFNDKIDLTKTIYYQR
ncbi:MAG: PKD domain-containing protein [Bacteroidota bacterium]